MLRHEAIQGEKVWKPILGAFIFLGLLLRTVRYLACYPLWSDEAFVAANFIRRGYLELLKPLDYGQICPILFLWPVRAIVGLFGFSEGSLRLFPLLCGFLSLGLFVKLSSKLLSGLPLVFAVSIFAVSAGPIRYSSEVKPYASDLLAALLLLNPALGWLQDRSRTASLWWLAALTPLALTLSHPAIFVAAGISLGMALSIWKAHDRRVLVPFVIFNAAIVVLFPALYFLVMLPQNSVLPYWREGYWENGFPPVRQPLLLIRWLIEAHTSKMLAYPGGGPRGASILTSLLLLAGSISLWKGGKRPALIVLLAAFGFTLIAATLRKYPYGNESRHMQYVAPAICLLAGLGLDVMIRALFKPSYRRRISALVLAVMFAGGLTYFGKIRDAALHQFL